MDGIVGSWECHIDEAEITYLSAEALAKEESQPYRSRALAHRR
jgi:hypothetical protein